MPDFFLDFLGALNTYLLAVAASELTEAQKEQELLGFASGNWRNVDVLETSAALAAMWPEKNAASRDAAEAAAQLLLSKVRYFIFHSNVSLADLRLCLERLRPMLGADTVNAVLDVDPEPNQFSYEFSFSRSRAITGTRDDEFATWLDNVDTSWRELYTWLEWLGPTLSSDEAAGALEKIFATMHNGQADPWMVIGYLMVESITRLIECLDAVACEDLFTRWADVEKVFLFAHGRFSPDFITANLPEIARVLSDGNVRATGARCGEVRFIKSWGAAFARFYDEQGRRPLPEANAEVE